MLVEKSIIGSFTLPNMITICRIVCSGALLYLEPFSGTFLLLYLFCGLSDVADGYLARKTKTSSSLGAALDSFADFIFCSVCLWIFLPLLFRERWMLYAIGLVALLRIATFLIGLTKYHTLAFLHTYANKATGFALFLFPFLHAYVGLPVTVGFLCSIAGLSAVEELLITIKAKVLSRNIPGIFFKRTASKACAKSDGCRSISENRIP